MITYNKDDIIKNIIWILHFLIALFFIFGPFIFNDKKFVLIYLICSIFLLLHWITNNNTCFLTTLESLYFNYDKELISKKGFFNRLINPVYDINDTNLYILLIMAIIFTLIKYLKKIDYNYNVFVNDIINLYK